MRSDRIFWVQRPNSNTFNDGEYKLRLLNDKVVGVGDRVVVKFSNNVTVNVCNVGQNMPMTFALYDANENLRAR